MDSLGWTIEEKIGKDGWKNNTGYFIKFSRMDWHGKYIISLTGHDVYFIGTTANAFNYEERLNNLVNQYNSLIKEISDEYNVKYINVNIIYRKGATDDGSPDI